MMKRIAKLGRQGFQATSDGADRAHEGTTGPSQPLAGGKSFHFFLCHHQGSGGDQCSLLFQHLKARGYDVWYDNDRSSNDQDLRGMKRGVQQSMCLLLFLSGRKEVDGQPDTHGKYEGTMTRWFCHEDMNEAHKASLQFVGVMETDTRKGKPDMSLERC